MEEQSRDYKTPVVIDEAFLVHLEQIKEQVNVKVRAEIARSEKLNHAELTAITDGKKITKLPSWKQETIKRRFDLASAGNFTIVYQDGSSVKTSDMGEIRAEFNLRSTVPTRFLIRMGSYDTLRVSLTIGGFLMSTAHLEIEGERADVRDTYKLFNDLIENSEPQWPIMYRWTGRVLAEILVLAAIIATFVLFTTHTPVNDPNTRSFISKSMPFSGAIAGGAATLFYDRLTKIFPAVQFSFGRTGRRSQSARTALWQAALIICIPIVLNAAPYLVDALGIK